MQNQTLSDARKMAGYSMEFMAGQLDISRPTYAKIEQDPTSASVSQAKRICELLSKNYENIFFGINAS